MAWASGQSVTAGSIATNLGYLFVFGAVDSGKNLVTSASYTTTFNTVTTGSDSIGTYVANTTGGYLQIATDVIGSAFPNADYSWFITFSREGSPANFAATFQWNDTAGGRLHANQGDGSTATQRFYSDSGYSTASLNLGTITASTEFTMVYVRTGATAKVFYTSGGSLLALTSVSFAPASNIGNLQISGWQSGEFYPGRFRAFGRWSRALSDAEAQSMANTPQQIITPAVTYTYARPASDITTQWTPSTGTSHYALINEVTPNDADYIFATAAAQTDEVKLGSMTTPTAGSSVNVNYRVQNLSGGASVTTSLYCNTTLIKADTARTANGTYTMTVSSAEWASVADWTNMRIRFVSA